MSRAAEQRARLSLFEPELLILGIDLEVRGAHTSLLTFFCSSSRAAPSPLPSTPPSTPPNSLHPFTLPLHTHTAPSTHPPPSQVAGELDEPTLRAAFRERSRLLHPDLNPMAESVHPDSQDGAVPSIYEVNQAFETIKRLL
jgi:hypothetical protein